jgi:hypothetical protein
LLNNEFSVLESPLMSCSSNNVFPNKKPPLQLERGFAYVYLSNELMLCGSCYPGQYQIPAYSPLSSDNKTGQILTRTSLFAR